MSANLPGHQGRRHVLRKALTGCSAVALGTALAWTGAASASVPASAQPAIAGSFQLVRHVQATLDDIDLPGSDVQVMNLGGWNLCLDAENDSGGNPSQNGDKVQLWTCNSGALQQRWDFSMSPQGVGVIINEDGGLCLDAENDAGGNPSENGDKVQLYTCNQSFQQTWYMVEQPNGSYQIFNDDGNLMLAPENDANGDPGTCGDNVQVQDYTGQSAQTWTTTGSYAQCYR